MLGLLHVALAAAPCLAKRAVELTRREHILRRRLTQSSRAKQNAVSTTKLPSATRDYYWYETRRESNLTIPLF